MIGTRLSRCGHMLRMANTPEGHVIQKYGSDPRTKKEWHINLSKPMNDREQAMQTLNRLADSRTRGTILNANVNG